MNSIINFLLNFFFPKKERTLNLNEWLKSEKLPDVEVKPLHHKSSIEMKIAGLRYYLLSPFTKMGVTPLKDQTFFQHLRSATGLSFKKQLFIKMADWLENDMHVSDIKSMDPYVNYLEKDFDALRPGSPIHIGFKQNSVGCRLLFVFEHPIKEQQIKRSLPEIVALIKKIDAHERENFKGYALINAFGMLEDPNTILKDFHDGRDSMYCFFLTNDTSRRETW